MISPLGHSGWFHVRTTQAEVLADRLRDFGAFCGPANLIIIHISLYLQIKIWILQFIDIKQPNN